jgi:LmbE family N-acetylglucosaminyl deacetylase
VYSGETGRDDVRHAIRAIGLLACLAACAAGCEAPVRDAGARAVDLLVFAPHPDDETLGCGGILLQALRRGERIKVVFFTNGDGFPGFASRIRETPTERLREEDFKELARYRQDQAQAALRILGAAPGDLIFLGYPDSGLEAIYQSKGTQAFRQKYTGMSETYGAAQPDYHSWVHGRPAPYTSASVQEDVEELIRTLRPRRVCVTPDADQHPDHRAAFRFVRDALERTDFTGDVYTYLIHGGPEWPWPLGSTPASRYDAHDVKGKPVPLGVPWPPPLRVPLTLEEAGEKSKAVQAHASHLAGVSGGALGEERTFLESFVKAEEVFWRWERR